MRVQASDYGGCGKMASAAVQFTAAALLLIGLGVGSAYSAERQTDVAYVEDVSGRVVAFVQGKPTLLDALDTIDDRTRLDLLANSELRICHYSSHRFLTLKGP